MLDSNMGIQPEHNVLYFLKKKKKFRVNNLKKGDIKIKGKIIFTLLYIMRLNKNKKKTYLFEIILTNKYNSL